MPRQPDTRTSIPEAQADIGLAALEARVEEIQVEAAEEIPAEAPRLAPAASEPPMDAPASRAEEPPAAPDPTPAPALATPGSPLLAVMGEMGACLQAAAQFQMDTAVRFASVRGPADLLRAQAAYGDGLVALFHANLDRVRGLTPGLAGGALR